MSAAAHRCCCSVPSSPPQCPPPPRPSSPERALQPALSSPCPCHFHQHPSPLLSSPSPNLHSASFRSSFRFTTTTTTTALYLLNIAPLILFLLLLLPFSHVLLVDCQAIEHSNASHLAVPKFFTLTKPQSAVRLFANGTVARRLIASKREISFDFRTRYSSGIILYETFYARELPGTSSSSTTTINRLYTLLLAIINGRFQVLLEGGDGQPAKELLLGYGFHRDHLHHVDLNIFPELNFLSVRINASSPTAGEGGRPYYHSLYFNGSSVLGGNRGSSAGKGRRKQSKLPPPPPPPSLNVDLLTYKLTFGRIPFAREAAYYSLNGYRPFVGCIGRVNIVSRSNESNFGTLSQATWATEAVEADCIDQCQLLNLCSRRSRCVNYYDSKACDCFGTELEDWHCRRFNYTVLTLRGYSTISYQIYRFLSRTFVDEQRISLHLRTAADSILFAGLAEARQSYLILNINGGYLNVLLNLGGNPKNVVFNDFLLSDGRWHNLTVVQKHSVMLVYLDTTTVHRIDFDEAEPFFFFDPEIYIGGFPSNLNISSLNLPIYLPNKKFIGCLKHVYYNAMNILYDLYHKHVGAKYHSLYPLETGCALENRTQNLTQPAEVMTASLVPITIQPNSYFRVPTNRTAHFQMAFEIRLDRFTMSGNSKIANGSLLTGNGERRRWHLWLRRQDVKLSIETVTHIDTALSLSHQQQPLSKSSMIGWTLSNDNSLNATLGVWNKVRIIAGSRGGFFKMTVNEETVQGRYTDDRDDEVTAAAADGLENYHFEGDVFLGSIQAGSTVPFVGCLRSVAVNYRPVEARTLAALGLVTGRVSLDDCQLLRPCSRPNACEHGGVCIPVPANGTYICDCSNTGYIGRTCHFSVYRRSCEEVYLMDKRHSGIFMIDIDRNGPLPPAHVICDLEKKSVSAAAVSSAAAAAGVRRSHSGAAVPDSGQMATVRTVIEHNIQHQVIVREPKTRKGHYHMDVVYRDFSPLMLRTLIRRSGRCQQYVKYECNDAPLSLASYTYLFSTVPDHQIRYIDSAAKGCKCKGANSTAGRCVDTTKDCNCDSVSPLMDSGGWRHDEGELTNSEDVGITKMYFFQLPNSTEETEAHLFIGNLSCVDVNTQQYEITFKTKQSYLQVPGWVGREMGISFRTTASKAVIFYQAHLDSTTTYFKAEIQSEKEVSFEYSLLGRRNRISISSGHCLNCGQWQHIWIERAEYQMRVNINQNSRIMYLGKNEKFIDFDGKLFVGGAPLEYLKGRKITTGYIGCLRGLVFDSEVIDLHRYLDSKRKPNIESGCRPYCKPNLCANQGHCVEKWGTYECRCANAIAHSGRNCEVNINENSATFKRAPAFLRKRFPTDEKMHALLTDDLIFSFRTHEKSALLLYAHDRVGNFLQVHIEDANVIFTYNWLRKIVRREIAVGNLLKSGQEVQVKVDRSYRNSSLLMVNSKSVFIPYPTAVLKAEDVMVAMESVLSGGGDPGDQEEPPPPPTPQQQIRWLKGQEFELVKRVNEFWTATPQGGELLIGGLAPDSATTTLPAFVGCIQGLVVGGKLIDLQSMAKAEVARIAEINKLLNTNNNSTNNNSTDNSNSTVISSNVAAGCTMLCDLMPCKNGGTCTEDWATESTKCDCESTSYRGDLCDLDIGALFSSKDASVLYHLEGGSGLVFDFDYVNISFAFSTASYENSTLLLLRYANSSRYLHLALLDDGRLLIEEDNGHQIYMSIIESEEDTFLDSHRHWVQYVRKEQHLSAEIIVDSLIYRIEPTADRDTLKAVQPSAENIIQIGSNRLNNTEMGFFHHNFRGCISNINIHLDDLRVDPFESAFGISSVGLSRVKVLGDVKQGVCAVFTTTDHRPSLSLSDAATLDGQGGSSLQILQGGASAAAAVAAAAGAEIWLSRPKPVLMRFNVSTDVEGEGSARYASSSYFVNTYLRRKYLMPLCIGYLLLVLFFVSIYMWRIDRRYKLLKFQGETPFFHKSLNNGGGGGGGGGSRKNGGGRGSSKHNNNNSKHVKRKNLAM